MNIFIFAANWYNHGDEAALRAMIDELKILYPDCRMKIQFNQKVTAFCYQDIEILQGFSKPVGRNKLKLIPYNLSVACAGRINLVSRKERMAFAAFVQALKWADYAIFAPGGPSLGDHYRQYQLLDMMYLMGRFHVPYAIFAPSMGPFTNYRNRIRKVLRNAEVICFREEISKGYFDELKTGKKAIVTLDSAFQHPVAIEPSERLLIRDAALLRFLDMHERVVGITITDLSWHREYRDTDITVTIRDTFTQFIDMLCEKNIGVLFIPQLFGMSDDSSYMTSFAGENTFVVANDYDCYFQQYLISRLYAVVGMRYHSNIFAAKMGTPFISVSYEQKMKGFMEKADLNRYCIPIAELSCERLASCFGELTRSYDAYKEHLMGNKDKYREKAYYTTEVVSSSINQVISNTAAC